MSWGNLVGASPLCMLHCKTCSRDTMRSTPFPLELWKHTKKIKDVIFPCLFSLYLRKKMHLPVLHRTNMVIHYSHGIPVGSTTHHHLKTRNLKHIIMTLHLALTCIFLLPFNTNHLLRGYVENSCLHSQRLWSNIIIPLCFCHLVYESFWSLSTPGEIFGSSTSKCVHS